jgi:hypothetical protein
MPTIHRSYYMEKPETLEVFSLTAEAWKDEQGNETSFSFLWRRGCSLSNAFDQEHHERFKTLTDMEKCCDTLYDEYRDKGFKTLEELGMQSIGVCHDEIFLNFRKQIIERYLEALVKKLDIPLHS